MIPAYRTKDIVPDERDIYMKSIEKDISRMEAMKAYEPMSNQPDNDEIYMETCPPEYLRKFEIAYKPILFEDEGETIQVQFVTDLSAKHVGQLVTIEGIVLHASQIEPRAQVLCYSCGQCHRAVFQLVKDPEFTPLFRCPGQSCVRSGHPGTLQLSDRYSKFIAFQKIKFQLDSTSATERESPAITIWALGQQCRKCLSSNRALITGVQLVKRSKTYFYSKNDTNREKTYFLAFHIWSYSYDIRELSTMQPGDPFIMSKEEAIDWVRNITKEDFYNDLAQIIAPNIYGLTDLKKALLLQLVGGRPIDEKDVYFRGEIHICIMGDPGCGKSQILGIIGQLAQRSQYATGTGSSGVGLTASVTRDPATSEFCLQPGALVLAHGGICCIDEFDKMLDHHRTCLYETMELGKVSVAKAGLNIRLNARTSVLAAANPAKSRWDNKMSVLKNLNLDQSLISRFDLMWLIKDVRNKELDVGLSNHITQIHSNPENMGDDGAPEDLRNLRRYINLCKTYSPNTSSEAEEELIEKYRRLRGNARQPLDSGDTVSLFSSPRLHMSIMRLSFARARLRLSDTVEPSDVKEAFRLYQRSLDSQNFSDETDGLGTAIMNTIRNESVESGTCSVQTLRGKVSQFGTDLTGLNSMLETLVRGECIEIDNDCITLINCSL